MNIISAGAIIGRPFFSTSQATISSSVGMSAAAH